MDIVNKVFTSRTKETLWHVECTARVSLEDLMNIKMNTNVAGPSASENFVAHCCAKFANSEALN